MEEGPDMKKLKAEAGKKHVAGRINLLDNWKCLPNHVKGLIVNKLAMLEVFRLCTVCKDFSTHWKQMQNLDFNKDVMQSIKRRGLNFDHITQRITAEMNGPLESFYLYVPRIDENIAYVEQWMQFLLLTFPKKVVIESEREEPVVNASTLLTCQSLLHLSLTRCRLIPFEGFMGFANLKTLKLNYITISRNMLQVIVSNSPLLEELYLSFENIDGPVIIDNASSLKKFYLEAKEYSNDWHLRLNAECPKLTVCEILSNLDIPAELQGRNKLDNFFNLLSAIEELTLTGEALLTLGLGYVPTKFTRLAASLQNLRELKFYRFEMKRLVVIACAFSIIRSSPNLQSLSIYTSYDYDEEDYGTFYADQASMCLSNSLVAVEISCNHGTYYDTFFIEMMLKSCPALETMYITNHPELVEDSDEELDLIHSIMEYERPASAIIKFHLAYEKECSHLFNNHEGGLYWISD